MLTTALLAGSLVTGWLAGPALRRLPEPTVAEGETKVPYRQLATRRFAIGVTACSMAALIVVALRLEPAMWTAWVPLATLGIFLVAIDAVTTWLPLRVTHLLWASTAIGLALAIAMAPRADRFQLGVRVVLGAALVGGFFWLFWWFTGGLGFGDVRLAPVLGATAATVSTSTVLAAVLVGTVAGAIHGLVRKARGRPGPFPYGPALVLGVFAALASGG